MSVYEELAGALYKGKAADVKQLVEQCLSEGKTPGDILNEGMMPGMNRLGQDFKANKVFIPEVLIAAKAMHAGMDVLKPLLVETGVEPVGKAVIGTVEGDLHDIGKNLVGMMLEGAGFEVIDLGVDCNGEAFVNAVKEHGAQLVGLSALITTTMTAMGRIIKEFEDNNLRDQVKIMIGGAPVDQNYANDIGADGYAPDAASAVEKARDLLGIAA